MIGGMLEDTITELASGLSFPEGPVAHDDGSLIVAEMFGERVTRIAADGEVSTLAEVAAGPNGCLIVCNNGRAFTPLDRGGVIVPGPFDQERYHGGLIQRLDADGSV